MNKVFYLLFCLLCFVISAYAQPTNDNCNNPINIPDVTNFCSKVGEYTNQDGTPSGYGAATCWTPTGKDVWFRFKAFFTDVSITVIGANINGIKGGTMARPMAALYKGVCGGTISELKCAADLNGLGILNIYQGGLLVGADYFIRIDGAFNTEGTFQLCINNFNPPAKAEQDCKNATVLCSKSPFVVQKLSGGGMDPDEAHNSCLGGNSTQNSESSSVWYTWTAANDGTLTFTLRPLNPSDDIDFAVYELPSGIHSCDDKIVLRCNATAPPCAGPTGLDTIDTDITEDLNCNPGENGYCKFIDMKQGRAYALIVNNFTNTGIGFSVEWGGSGEFASPIANFGVMPMTGLKCESDFTVIDSSSSSPSINIIRWDWNFGEDAVPQKAIDNTQGQTHSVRYTSFGEKFITLTITTTSSNGSPGCQLTEIRRIYVEPCCQDIPTLKIHIDSLRNLTCFHSNDGMIAVEGDMGSPYNEVINGVQSVFYEYSIDGQSFTSTNVFTQLKSGTHSLVVHDRKGCIDSIQINIIEPLQVVADAGNDTEIDLGDRIDLNANAMPANFYKYLWYHGDSITCKDCQNTSALPFNDGYYSVIATDQNGCTGLDSLFVRVRKNYNVYPPNVFSPNGDNINDVFHVTGSKSLASIESMQIFDRWGDLLYNGVDLNPNDPAEGWNGRANNEPCIPGVYVYLLRAHYLDGHIETVSGNLTLLR